MFSFLAHVSSIHQVLQKSVQWLFFAIWINDGHSQIQRWSCQDFIRFTFITSRFISKNKVQVYISFSPLISHACLDEWHIWHILPLPLAGLVCRDQVTNSLEKTKHCKFQTPLYFSHLISPLTECGCRPIKLSANSKQQSRGCITKSPLFELRGVGVGGGGGGGGISVFPFLWQVHLSPVGIRSL